MKIVVEKDIESIKDVCKKALNNDKIYARKYRIKTLSGNILWIQESSQMELSRITEDISSLRVLSLLNG